MIVERADFVSVPVRDLERATRFYADTLGLEQVSAGGWPEFQLGENISVYLMDPASIGQEFTAPHSAHIALRVDQPTEPSIWSWISRFISTAYSSGSSFVIGSTKPETINADASPSESPRDIR